jgi:membrane protease YdiL (CAAX protease family)
MNHSVNKNILSSETPTPLGVWQMLGLHLIPGALITIFYFLTAPAVIHAGYPPLMALFLAILLILIPFELGFLAYQGKQLNGRYSLEGVVLFRDRTPTWQLVSLTAALVVWCGLAFGLLTAIDNFFVQGMENWLPSWSLPANLIGDPDQYSKSAFALTVFLGFLLNGFAGPCVEELYFRGYLLPRIPSSTQWAPLINVLLFSLYHFFSPWQNVTRIIAFMPFAYVVAWKRDVHISMWAHSLMNTLGMIQSLAVLL